MTHTDLDVDDAAGLFLSFPLDMLLVLHVAGCSGACLNYTRQGMPAPTRFLPSTSTLGYFGSLITFLTVPSCPLSLPAKIMTVSPRRIFHLSRSNMAFKALRCGPILGGRGLNEG